MGREAVDTYLSNNNKTRYKPDAPRGRLLFFAGGVRMHQQQYSGGVRQALVKLYTDNHDPDIRVGAGGCMCTVVTVLFVPVAQLAVWKLTILVAVPFSPHPCLLPACRSSTAAYTTTPRSCAQPSSAWLHMAPAGAYA